MYRGRVWYEKGSGSRGTRTEVGGIPKTLYVATQEERVGLNSGHRKRGMTSGRFVRKSRRPYRGRGPCRVRVLSVAQTSYSLTYPLTSSLERTCVGGESCVYVDRRGQTVKLKTPSLLTVTKRSK